MRVPPLIYFVFFLGYLPLQSDWSLSGGQRFDLREVISEQREQRTLMKQNDRIPWRKSANPVAEREPGHAAPRFMQFDSNVWHGVAHVSTAMCVLRLLLFFLCSRSEIKTLELDHH